MNIEHPISPVYDENCVVLILGSFPSVKSREEGFFYGHPRNRFWTVLSQIFNENMPMSIEDKTKFLLKHNIALWDVIKSCEIVGSSDSSIKNVIPNDINKLISNSNINYIITNGKKADELYNKYILSNTSLNAHCLPSTSPANATWNNERLVKEWGEYFKSLQID